MRWFLVAVSCVYVVSVSSDRPVVETKLGKYKGHYVTTFEGRQISAFNGIRYGKKPVRFHESEMVEAHSDEYDASKDGDDCLQVTHSYNNYPFEEYINKKIVGSEDCLFLNVYTPDVKTTKPYPVMIWIHGGGFMIGTGGSVWHGPDLLLDKDIVLVAMNYRLGPIGFLSYDDEVLPGNLGLKDQSLAIRWVKENIAYFGGDPDSITIFGESAGAASVHLQMLSPRNEGMFQRAISQSGSVDCPWAITSKTKAKQYALKLAAKLECPTIPESLLKCLQEKTAEQIMDAADSLKTMDVKLEMIFKPVFETKKGGFISEENTRVRSTIPWISGVTSGEGILIYTEIAMAGDGNLTKFNDNYKDILPALLNYETYPNAEKITKLIKQNYIGDDDFTMANFKKFVNMFSDGLFIKGQLTSAIKHEGKNYFYLLTHEGERSFSTFSHVQHLKAGVHHGDDLFYMFPAYKVYPKLNFNDEDRKVQKLMVDLWTNFAIHGNPTPRKNEQQWYESETGKIYVTISSKGIKLSKNLYSTRMNFWDNLPTNMYQYHPPKDEL